MKDKQIVTDWFKKYHNDVLNFLIYYSGHADVEDYVQEVFLNAIKYFDSYEEHASPKTWLFSIARNVAIDAARKKKREQAKVFRIVQNEDKVNSLPNTPEEIYKLNETKIEIYNLIATFKQSYRDILILRGIQELSVSEVSQILNWSESKVHLTYHRALKSLSKKIGGTYFEA